MTTTEQQRTKESKYYWSEANANGTAMGRYLTGIETEFLERTLARVGWPRRVLDVGGGDGRFAHLFSRHGSMPVVLERDRLPLVELLEKGWDWPVLLADGMRLPFMAGSFDMVLAMEVAQVTDSSHLGGFLEETSRVLARHGLVGFTTENPLSAVGLLKRASPGRYRHGDFEYYTNSLRGVLSHLAARSFRPISAWGFRWLPFSRQSNSRLIPVAAHLERLLGLHTLPAFSPWVLWVARRG